MSKPYAKWKAACREHTRRLGAYMGHMAFVGDPSAVKVYIFRPSAESQMLRRAKLWACWKARRDHGAPENMANWEAASKYENGKLFIMLTPAASHKASKIVIGIPNWEA